jgi:LPXTG-motif cell wall-anchored protein
MMSTFWEQHMKKLSSLGAVALVALLTGLVVLGLQSQAQAYPDVQINLTVNRQTIYSHQSFTATATSQNTTCDWTLEWNGDTRHASDTHKFVTTYTGPKVTEVTKIPLHGTCTYPSSTARSGQRTAASSATWQRTIVITVLPRGAAVSPPTAGGSSDLPSTGGPNRLFLAGGLVLLITGASAVTLARRRAEEAEIAASRY